MVFVSRMILLAGLLALIITTSTGYGREAGPGETDETAQLLRSILKRLDEIESDNKNLHQKILKEMTLRFDDIENKMDDCCDDYNRSTPTQGPTSTPTPSDRPLTTPTTTNRPTTTPTNTPTTSPSTTPTTTKTPTSTTPWNPQEVIFLHRLDGTESFYRDWAAYKSGFGTDTGEFWLGLDRLSSLTTRSNYRLRAEVTDWSGEVKWSEYANFRVSDEENKYQLHISGYGRDSTAGDSLTIIHGINGMYFSTLDRDNDGWMGDCADRYRGGWWYNDCAGANPTGLYKPAGYTRHDGIFWYFAYNDYRSFKEVTLRIIKA